MKTALISVFNKSNVIQFATFLLENNYQILSSGGTYNKLKMVLKSDLIKEISLYTQSPEILNGRVKTLHPKIHGGILAKRSDSNHIQQLKHLEIQPIDIVVCNLYPFKEVIEQTNTKLEDAIENIDIGGITLLRAAAKNYQDVLTIVDTNDYTNIIDNFEKIMDPNNNVYRGNYATKVFKIVTEYDARISNYFDKNISTLNNVEDQNNNVLVRVYEHQRSLKYGCNPQQSKAALYKNIEQKENPFEVLNGNPGYINLLDAIYSWNLVCELRNALNLPAAASFKHTSPAGAAVYVPLSELMRKVYNISEDKELTPLACAFIRARNADPMCSYGDFIALSHEVDEATARIISIEISDGIIAPGYSREAFEILNKKKNGQYVILKGNVLSTTHNICEMKELHGTTLVQEENNAITNKESFQQILTENKLLTEEAQRDLIVANTALKYTQSNSVAYAKDGQCIGIGAGQQSRIDCVKLAKRKSETWYLRQHPKCVALFDEFKKGTKRQVKTNAVVSYIENDYTDIELKKWKDLFNKEIETLSENQKKDFIKTLDHVSLASDAFFPFRDNIDTAVKVGVRYILQPGGSVADKEVIEACNDYQMVMAFSGAKMRMFLH